jgi:hypothetical protein
MRPRAFITRDGRRMRARPVRLYRVARAPEQTAPFEQPAPSPHSESASAPPLTIQPMTSGRLFRIVSPPGHAQVTAQLARHLSKALEQFAEANGFTQEKPLILSFGRGTLGLHRSHRAADIYAVGGKGIVVWAQEWIGVMRRAAAASNPQERESLITTEKQRNLGHKLYKALQSHGGWAQPPRFPIQLFGPWTRGEGPHKKISDRLLHAHRDHIHVAR